MTDKEIAASPTAPRNDESSEVYEGNGILMNSGEWDGFEVPKDMGKVLDYLEEKGMGIRKANYHLRDWLISRQRYWGPPIPMIYCETCAKEGKSWFTSKNVIANEVKQSGGIVPQEYLPFHGGAPSQAPRNDNHWSAGWYLVSESDLPVLLPDVKDWRPEGEGTSPLASHPEFYKTKCPGCGGDAKRETDVSDTFLDSSWYYLRYPSCDIENAPFDIARTSKWLPVNMYIGGAEHAVLHLLYSRFVAMVLHDLGFLSFEEPFSTFYAHGLIIKDGAKMSKSKGNVVVPDEYIKKYGADALRTYLMFLGPYEDGGDFRDSGIEGMNKFLRKVWKLLSSVTASGSAAVSEIVPQEYLPFHGGAPSQASRNDETERLRIMHKTIQKVTKDIKEFGYNTAIASLMEWYNYLSSEDRRQEPLVSREEKETYLKLLAPFAPHMTEELWQQHIVTASGSAAVSEIATSRNSGTRNDIKESIHLSSWPEHDESLIIDEKVTVVVQVNGKRRAEIEIGNQEIEDKSLVENKAKEQVLKYLEGLTIKKTIYISGKIVNFVV
jgi:leucyl-tRNA synthetase